MRILGVAGMVVAAIAAAGCASSGVDQATSVSEKVRVVAAELEKGQLAIDGAVQSLNAIDAKGDLKTQFKTYSAKLDDLEGQAATIRSGREKLEKNRAEYVKAWEERQATITNEDLRKKGEARKNELVSRFNDIGSKAEATRATYDSMIKDMRDVQKYLENDLNATGLAAVGDMKKEAGKGAEDTKKGLKDLIADLKKIADDLAAATPPPAPTK